MQKITRNITLAVSEDAHQKARRFAFERRTSLSAIVGFLLENLPTVTLAVRQILAQNPRFGAETTPAPPEENNFACETVKSS